MPTYSLPQFNLHARGWAPGSNPLTDPQTWPDFICQLYTNPKPQGQFWQEYVIRRPVDHTTAWFPGFRIQIDEVSVNIPAGYFEIASTAIMHKSFPNEYWAFNCFMCQADGTPLDIVG